MGGHLVSVFFASFFYSQFTLVQLLQLVELKYCHERGAPMKTNAQIEFDVIQELRWDPQVNSDNIEVVVNDGVVTLLGTVPTFPEKIAAEHAVQRVTGVKATIERIEVQLPHFARRTDNEIAKAIREYFAWNIQVPSDKISPRVEDGWVELSGEVQWEYQRSAAIACVRSLCGVRGLTNNIAIKARDVEPEMIKRRIEEALKREAERDAHICVEVRGNRVILSGEVCTFTDMQRARRAAYSAPGVTSVENNLRIH